MADPDPAQFWQKVTEIDSHGKVRTLKLRNLREYQRYFVEVQYQDLAPADKTAAPLHLTRLQQEIDRRSHARTQWIAAASALLALVGILMGQFQRKTRTQSTTALAISYLHWHSCSVDNPSTTVNGHPRTDNRPHTEHDAHTNSHRAQARKQATVSPKALVSVSSSSRACAVRIPTGERSGL